MSPLPERRRPRKPIRRKDRREPDSEGGLTMANSKAEILDAAVAAGLGDADELDARTKPELLDMLGGES